VNCDKSIMNIKGVGAKTFEKLKRLGISSIKDSIYYYPRDYVDRGKIKFISEFLNEEYGTVRAFVETVSSRGRYGHKGNILKLTVVDKTMKCDVVFFNAKFISDKFKAGKEFFFYGQIKFEGYRRVMMHPEFIESSSPSIEEFLSIRPIYSLTKELSQNEIFKIQKKVFKELNEIIPESLPETVILKNELCSGDYAVRKIHFPDNFKELECAKNRLVYEELFKLQMTLYMIKRNTILKVGPSLSDIYVSDIIESLPFKLTEGQNDVIKEIFNDSLSQKPMNRLVQGDVGSGKTVVAMIAMAAFAREGFQSVLMVPTEILAEQHYSFFNKYCEDEGVELLTGSSKKKDIIYEKIKMGNSKIIIGTHALIQDKVEYNNLAFVVTDEQHRFGVRQRSALFEKGNNPNVLIMTATPIPRTLSLILYGDVDISIIRDIPKGRLKVKTHYVKKEKINDMYGFIRKNIRSGRQAFFICPLVEDSDELNLTSIEKYYEKIKNIFSEFNVGFIFGKMKSSEKEEIMKSFSRNELNILIATTVIEVGIDIPNANIMVINDSERFGLAQLHQLRGRVGRGKHQSYCFLTSNNLSEMGKQRIKTMCGTNNGFEIADKDLELRGPGEIIGVRQHGIPEFKIANLARDLEVLKKVQEDVSEIIRDFTPESMNQFFEVYLRETFNGFTI